MPAKKVWLQRKAAPANDLSIPARFPGLVGDSVSDGESFLQPHCFSPGTDRRGIGRLESPEVSLSRQPRRGHFDENRLVRWF